MNTEKEKDVNQKNQIEIEKEKASLAFFACCLLIMAPMLSSHEVHRAISLPIVVIWVTIAIFWFVNLRKKIKKIKN